MAKREHYELKFSKDYYANRLRSTSFALFWMQVISLAIIGGLFLVELFEPSMSYYATTSTSQVFPLKALSTPNRSPKALLKPDPPEEFSIKQLSETG